MDMQAGEKGTGWLLRYTCLVVNQANQYQLTIQ
jgi:hypothetical protein